MYEQEKHRATHLVLLVVYTFFVLVLTGESLLLGWDISAIVLFILGMVASWVLHITEMIPDSIRLWLYYILMMLTFFFYGIHETSVYDLAPVMMIIILLFSFTEQYLFIKISVATYFFTMLYALFFVMRGSMEITPLEITRTLLHFCVVYIAGQLVKVQMMRYKKERKRSDDIITELEETNRRTEDFLTNVSHELRTPINAVTGITTTILKNEEDVNRRNDIHAIQVAGQRLFNQIGDILDYTEIDTGRIKVSEENYMMTSLINDVIIASRLAESKKDLELIFDVDATIPSVLVGDEKKIKKILLHLIDNAVKFTQKGGIYVRIYALKKSYGINLCIKVTDTGYGIVQKELEKIRERFYQANGGRNRRAGGLGLGLSIVYGMVSAMEGFIQIASAEGKGTTVSVSIPQKVADESASMTVEKKDALCLACYISPEKYEIPEVRDFYNDMISHIVEGLEIPLHRVSSIDELIKLMSIYQLTHLFLAKEEYEENASYIESLDSNVRIFVIANDDLVLSANSRVTILKKPFYCLPVVNILNAGTVQEELLLKDKNMICPGVRILVVDDEPMNLMVAEGILKSYQMIVKTVESGKKAIELCEKEEFDLIFLDHMMPEMDGVETIKRLRKLSSDIGRTFTIVAFTANAVSGAREMFLKEGFDEFISKPIEPLEMERVLRKILPQTAISYVNGNDKVNSDKYPVKEQQNVQQEQVKEEKREQTAKQNPVHTIADGHPEEDKMAKLEQIGIHTHTGLQYNGGDRVFYEELLTKFAKDADRKEKDIIRFFEQEDYKNYCILVHALKSTAKMIGADSLSEKAKCLEMAAKNNDDSFIRENHDEMVETYRQVVHGISDVFDLEKEDADLTDKKDKVELSKEELLQQLEKLKESLNNYEVDEIDDIISQLSETVYQGKSVKEMISRIVRDVEDFEYTLAVEKTEACICKLEGGDVE